MWNPINRTTVQTEENKYRIYPKAGPINYKKSDGTFDTIDHTFNDTTSSIGDISLMDKGILSVGKRKGNNPTKVVGIRPDNNQHLGTQQLEFSLVNVELDGESQSFNVETDLEIKLKASKVFQLVKINKDFDDFKIEFDIHSTGLELQNNKYSQTTTLRDYGFNLTNLGEIDTSTTSLKLDGLFTGSKSTPYIDFRTTKITNNYITTGQYTNEEEFGDNDLSNYTLDNSVYPNGSSVYYKDCIIFLAKSYNIDEDIEQIMINNLCDLYGLENFDDGGIGQYLTKDNKKVIGYYAWDNVFYGFINTKAIPDDIKTLFQRKTFDDTSFLDITLSDFNTSITNKFNKNLKIDLDTNYYEPINNKFVFNINNEKMYINLPIIFDKDYNNLNIGTTHSLKQNNDGSYRYTKYFSVEGYLNSSNDIKYIDATLSSSDAEDNIPAHFDFGTSTFKKTSSNLTAIRDKINGSLASTVDTITRGNQKIGDIGTIGSGQSGVTRSWLVYQNHIIFDSSGVSGTISDLELKLWAAYSTVGGSHNDISLIVLKSNTEGGNILQNWNDFPGHTSGWDDTDVTEYSAEYVVDGYEETNTSGVNISNYVEEAVPLNSTAESDISSDDSFKLGLVDYDQFYLNSIDTSYGYSTTGRRIMWSGQVDGDTVSERPYLEFTAGAASGYGNAVAGLASANISKVKGVATANISKVSGV